MAGFKSFGQIKNSMQSDGKFWHASFRKVVSNATVAGTWCDLSYSPGSPPANFYATEPLAAATLMTTGALDLAKSKGIDNGGPVSPAKKYLKKLLVYSSSTAFQSSTLMLCDYVLYYPFIDGDETSSQTLNNDVTLPRYTTGAGLQAMLVSQGAYTGNVTFQINYTNSSNVSGRVSPLVTTNTAALAATIVNSGTQAGGSGPFIPLQSGDTGIRSVQSITFTSPNGGIMALVLVKPIAEIGISEVTATFSTPSQYENFYDFVSGQTIEDGAYLNFICLPNASLAAATVSGIVSTTWG
jgi:hypothetical protein